MVNNTDMGVCKPYHFPLKSSPYLKNYFLMCGFRNVSRNSSLLPFHSGNLLQSKALKHNFRVIEDVLTLGGGHTMHHTDDVS